MNIDESSASICLIAAGSAIICPTHIPCYAPRAENSFYKCDMTFLCVSTVCAQILGFSRISATL